MSVSENFLNCCWLSGILQKKLSDISHSRRDKALKKKYRKNDKVLLLYDITEGHISQTQLLAHSLIKETAYTEQAVL